MSEDERNDPERANFKGRHCPREKNAAPFYIRCSWFKEDKQCLMADGHGGEHRYAKDAE